MRISLIGYGTVGQGVAGLLDAHAARYAGRVGEPIDIVAVLVRDASKGRAVALPRGAVVTDSPDAFFRVESDILIEVAGGIEPAFTHIARAIEAGRDVVTANKALLAVRGDALFALAHQHRRRIGFEASVAGGLPAIGLVHDMLGANRIEAFAGIVNGTCNFILSQMGEGETSIEGAVREAQQLGYAEADPTFDLTGRDSLEKLAILARVAFRGSVDIESIPNVGLDAVEPIDLRLARELGCAIKLLAIGKRAGSRFVLHNGPALVPTSHPLARVDGAQMGLHMVGDAIPSLFIAGDGAGRFPTASAVVGDILHIARERATQHTPAPPLPAAWPTGCPALSIDADPATRWYVRVEGIADSVLREALSQVSIECSRAATIDRAAAILTTSSPLTRVHSAVRPLFADASHCAQRSRVFPMCTNA